MSRTRIETNETPKGSDIRFLISVMANCSVVFLYRLGPRVGYRQVVLRSWNSDLRIEIGERYQGSP